MDGPSKPHERSEAFHFGPYEVSSANAELFKDGVRLNVPVESLRVLLVLLEHAGEIVKQEEFRDIWAENSAADIDLRLNAAVNKLRQALGDDATRPVFLEKILGQGYRFVAPVTVIGGQKKPSASRRSDSELVSSDKSRERYTKKGAFAVIRGAREQKSSTYLMVEPDQEDRHGEQASTTNKISFLRSPVVTTLLIAGLFFGVMLLPPQSPKDPAPDMGSSGTVVPIATYSGIQANPAVSPDGKRVAFAWTGPQASDPYSIYVKQIGEEHATQVTRPPHDGSDRAPVWTPDGSQLLFHRRASTGNGIYITPVSGGEVRRLIATNLGETDVRHLRFDISPDGKTVVYADRPAGDAQRSIFLLDIASSQVRQLTFPAKESAGDIDPVFSPDGKSVAFGRDALDLQQIYVVATAGGPARRITSTNKDQMEGLVWTSDGRGILIGGRELRRVSLSEADNIISALPTPPGPVNSPSLRDGKLAYVQEGFTANIWSLELSGTKRVAGLPKLLISSTRQQAAPSVSPDNSAIAFQSDRSGFWEIWVSDRDGSNAKQLTSFKGPLTGTPRWSPDGRQIALDSRVNGNSEIYLISPGGGQPRRVTEGAGNNAVPSWSRDARWIYFSSNRTGRMEVWKMPSSGGQPQQLTRAGGIYAAESLNGQYVYYSKSPIDATLWRVSTSGGVEEKLAAAPLPDGCSHWTLGREGIYVIDPHGDLLYFDLASRQVTKLAHHPQFRTDWSMAVSPDESTVFWVQIDAVRSDLMLAENFHPK